MRIAAVLAALALAASPVLAGGSRALQAPERTIALPLPELPAAVPIDDAMPLDAAAALSSGLDAGRAQAGAPIDAELPAVEASGSRPLAALRRFLGLGRRDAVEKVTAALAGMPAVRAYFAEAPGFGHQSSTLAAARRLRELGYRGKIQGIYGPGAEQKLGVLLPEFDAKGPAVQDIPSLAMTLESQEHFEARADRKPVSLALTGGNDLDGKATSKLAWLLGAKMFLNLQPLGWRNRPNEIYRDDGSKERLPWAKLLPLIYRPTRPEQLDDVYFDALRRQAALTPAKIDGLRALTRRLGEHDLLPAYGLAFFDEALLHRVLLGVSEAMERRPRSFSRGGVVVPLLLDAQVLVDPLKDGKGPKDSDWSASAESRRLAQVAQANERLKGKLEFARIDDPDLGARLDALRPGRILVLEAGTVPPAVFESLFAASTLPPTLEGKNAAVLARILGIPFLSINTLTLEDSLAIGVGAARAHVRLGLRQLGWRAYGARRAAAAAGALAEWTEPRGLLRHDFETLASYILEAARPGSRLRRWFARHRLRQDDFRKDKLVRSLRVALVGEGRGR